MTRGLPAPYTGIGYCIVAVGLLSNSHSFADLLNKLLYCS